ncbi:hypothetical protein D918_06817 [Trichuris suis]|nr:hypothetical protein D918_06817 [Trichuris suis]
MNYRVGVLFSFLSIYFILIHSPANCNSPRVNSQFAKFHKKPPEQFNFRENLRQVKTDKWNLDALKIDKKEVQLL